MVDRITKAFRKVPLKEQRSINAVLKQIRNGQIWDLDIKKLKGLETIYRVRKGNWRIICSLGTNDTIKVLAIERRSDITYEKY